MQRAVNMGDVVALAAEKRRAMAVVGSRAPASNGWGDVGIVTQVDMRIVCRGPSMS